VNGTPIIDVEAASDLPNIRIACSTSLRVASYTGIVGQSNSRTPFQFPSS
jgi:hypothetical protein